MTQVTSDKFNKCGKDDGYKHCKIFNYNEIENNMNIDPIFIEPHYGLNSSTTTGKQLCLPENYKDNLDLNKFKNSNECHNIPYNMDIENKVEFLCKSKSKESIIKIKLENKINKQQMLDY